MRPKLASIWCGLLLAFGVVLSAEPAMAGIGSISVAYATPTTATVTMNHDGYTAIQDPNGYRYEVCWRTTSQFISPCYQTGQHFLTNDVTNTIPGVVVGTTYEVKVRCRCKKDSPWGSTFWREVGETTFVFVAPPPPLTLVSTTNVRVRGVQTGQCLYVYGGTMYGWGCWNDPNMKFAKEVYSDGHVRLRHLSTGACIWGFTPYSSSLRAGGCGMLGTQLTLVSQGGGKVWIQIPLTRGSIGSPGPGGCARSNASNGSTASKAACSGDPKMLFVLDPA